MPITLEESDYAARMYALAQSEGHVQMRNANLDKYVKCIDGKSFVAFNSILEEEIIEYLETEGPKTIAEISREYEYSEKSLRRRLSKMEKRGSVKRLITRGPMKYVVT